MADKVRPALLRHTEDRMVAGVALGLAAHLGVDVRRVRIGFVVAGLFGVGVVVYGLAIALMPTASGNRAPASGLRVRNSRDVVGVLLILIGGAQLLTALASNWIVFASLLVFGAAVVVAIIATLPSEAMRDGNVPQWLPPAFGEAVRMVRGQRSLLLRTIMGGLIALIGMGLLLLRSQSWSQLVEGFAATGFVIAGGMLALGPWLSRLGDDLLRERRERIRTEERAEMAAHLHDSVLQTLALVQRNSTNAKEVARLARVQERELRNWLLRGDHYTEGAATFIETLDTMTAELELLHTTAIDVVHVRDCEMDETIRPIVAAAREAIANAQRHSNADRISVYTEVDEDEVRVFVRDRGIGFDRDCVGADRGGLVESIEGRMRRHGGSAAIRSEVGVGTEVELVMPRQETR